MADYKIKVNNNHGGKEFNSGFHFVGKVKPIKEKDKNTDNWEDIPFYSTEEDGKKKVFQFIVETALSNELKVKVTGKEKPYAYPYSRQHGKSAKVEWNKRFNKEGYPDNTYHLIEPEWDRIEKFKEIVEKDCWVEVKGKYIPYEFEAEDGKVIKGISRQISFINPINEEGKVIIDGEVKEIKVDKNTINYVCDFQSPDFIEVNRFNMQIGINTTYQDSETGDTKVNAVVLTNGVERSEPKDVEMMVYQKKVEQGISMADAFASLNTYDFIEVIGQDNNRATFAYVDVVEEIGTDDPFSQVDSREKVTRQERVTNGDKKGLEVISYVQSSLMRELLTEEELRKTVALTSNDPFNSVSNSDDPFSQTDKDPFSSSNSNKVDDPFA
ncbi:hypothetical protein HUB98_05995 [Paenibacillus barcinonensis]|uniref:Uncharacterized protein n=1 Tax=Paenibacillus barcinonensis TaxID=198119 RepID=A0A2V4VDA4_PAEBA|nr:hypothetical protein [Paenibacillus barcinonensis]PYE51562.1 hypothetical protein DFQ00_102356 [Paenibacillus barcinonensis]QKS55932.1 hypothetical protein HUB98_05995 [Paenibacillus barcinonensis]